MNTKEIFRDIPNYNGLYQVSNLGNVKSLSRKVGVAKTPNGKGFRVTIDKILSPGLNNAGYMFVYLRKDLLPKVFAIHQLVAMAFLDHKPNGFEIVVDHKDEDKLNNNLTNLRLLTHRQNCSRKSIGTSKYIGVCFCKSRGKWASRIRVKSKRINLGYFNSEIEASNAYQKQLSIINKSK